jgi:hypothetical protein
MTSLVKSLIPANRSCSARTIQDQFDGVEGAEE